MELDNTEVIMKNDAGENGGAHIVSPILFVCQGKSISEYRLEGRQVLGRPSGEYRPDIPVFNRFVSRQHGAFEVEGDEVWYSAFETTNPTKHRGRSLEAGQRIRLRDGEELTISSESECSSPVVMIVAGSASRVNLWRELQQASRDELTSLYGRDGFTVWWFENCGSKDYLESALFILDVDNFKAVNDSKGHNVGDLILKLVADELRKTVRYDNQICRWGGDEFVGLIPGNRDQVEARLRDAADRITKAAVDNGVFVTVSVGYVEVNTKEKRADIDSLVEKADKALYSVKQNGRNNISGYVES